MAICISGEVMKLHYVKIWLLCISTLFFIKSSYAADIETQAVFPDLITNNETFSVSASLFNVDTDAHDIELTAQLYRGAKKYWNDSISYFLEANESFNHDFYGSVSIEPGLYKLKIKVRKDSQKTTHDIIREVNITGTWNKKQAEYVSTEKDFYEQRKIALYLLLAVSVALNIVLIWKR